MSPVNNLLVNIEESRILETEIEDLRNKNIPFQAVSRYNVCLEQPNHPYLQLVSSNTVENWIQYFKINNNIYSKGLERLTIWGRIFNNNIQLRSIPHKNKYFVLSALIILFQVYGDGNHRTASYFYNKYTGGTLNLLLISRLVIDYSNQTGDSIYNLINQLIDMSDLQM